MAVIEVEHHRIGAAAVDAWVDEEVGDHQCAVLDTVSVDPRDLAPDVLLAIRQVVSASVRCLALPAVPLPRSLRHIGERELGFGFGLAAHVAGEHASTSVGTEGPPPRTWEFRPLEHMFA